MSTLVPSCFQQPYQHSAFPPTNTPMWRTPFPLDLDDAASNDQPFCRTQATIAVPTLLEYQPSACPLLSPSDPPIFLSSTSTASCQEPLQRNLLQQTAEGAAPLAMSTPPAQLQQRQQQKQQQQQQQLAEDSTNVVMSDAPVAPPPAKRRRGRPRKQLPVVDDAGSLFQADAYPSAVTETHGRSRVLERNRIAATKCRNRKRDEAKDLEAQEHEVEERHRHLSAMVAELRTNLVDLKTQLLRHTDCRCVVIQKYIAHHAEKAVGELTESSPPPFAQGTVPCRSSTTPISASDSTDSLQTPWSESLSSPTSQNPNPIPPPLDPTFDTYGGQVATLPSQSHMINTPPLASPYEYHLQALMVGGGGVMPTCADHHVSPSLPVQQHVFWTDWAQ